MLNLSRSYAGRCQMMWPMLRIPQLQVRALSRTVSSLQQSVSPEFISAIKLDASSQGTLQQAEEELNDEFDARKNAKLIYHVPKRLPCDEALKIVMAQYGLSNASQGRLMHAMLNMECEAPNVTKLSIDDFYVLLADVLSTEEHVQLMQLLGQFNFDCENDVGATSKQSALLRGAKLLLKRIWKLVGDVRAVLLLPSIKQHIWNLSLTELQQKRRERLHNPPYESWLVQDGHEFSGLPVLKPLAREDMASLLNDSSRFHGFMVDHLPVDITAHRLTEHFSVFGNVKAIELFTERVPVQEMVEFGLFRHSNHLPPIAPHDEFFCRLYEETGLINIYTKRRRNNERISTRGRSVEASRPVIICNSNVYALIYFDSKSSIDTVLAKPNRVFGFAIEDTILSRLLAGNKKVIPKYRSSYPDLLPKNVFVGGIPYRSRGHAIENELYDAIAELCSEVMPIEGCIQTDDFNVGNGSIILQFSTHDIAKKFANILANARLYGRRLQVGWFSDRALKRIKSQRYFDRSQRFAAGLLPEPAPVDVNKLLSALVEEEPDTPDLPQVGVSVTVSDAWDLSYDDEDVDECDFDFTEPFEDLR